MDARLCAELRSIKPVTLAEALAEYAADVKKLTDEQLAHEVARVEALPGGYCRIANDEADARQNRAALLAAMAPPQRWGWTR